MPAEVHELAEKLKGKPGVKNEWALAHSIIAHRHKARLAKRIHDKEMQEEKRNGE